MLPGDGALAGSQLATGEGLELIDTIVRVELINVHAHRGRDRILPPEAITRQIISVLDPLHVLAGRWVPPAQINNPAELIDASVRIIAGAEGQVVA